MNRTGLRDKMNRGARVAIFGAFLTVGIEVAGCGTRNQDAKKDGSADEEMDTQTAEADVSIPKLARRLKCSERVLAIASDGNYLACGGSIFKISISQKLKPPVRQPFRAIRND